MGRGATKASGNVWYQARIDAAKYNEKLSSRMGAAELAGMSEDAIKSTELGLEKCMPVDKAVILADLYNAPNLLNYYCIHNCPIGSNASVSDEVVSLDRVTVKLVKAIKTGELDQFLNKLIGVACDGEVTEDEIEDLEEVCEYLEGLSKTVSELRTVIGKIK